MIKSLFLASTAFVGATAACVDKPQLVVTLWDSFGDGWDTAFWTATDPSDLTAQFQPSCADAEILFINPCDHSTPIGNYSMEVSTADSSLPEGSWEVYWRVDVVDSFGSPTGTYLEGGYGTSMTWEFDGDSWSLTDSANEANTDCVACSGSKCSKSKSKKKASKSSSKKVKKLKSNAKNSPDSQSSSNSSSADEVEVYTYGSPNTDLTVEMRAPEGSNDWNDVSPIGARWTISDITNTEIFETGSLCKGKKGECKICLGDGTYIFRATSEVQGGNNTDADIKRMLKSGPKGGASDSNSTESEETYSEESSNSTDGKDGRGKKGPSRPRRNKPSRPSKKDTDSESNSTYDMLKGGPLGGSDSNSTESEETYSEESSNSTDGKDGRGKKGPSGPRRNKPSRPSKKGADSESNSTYDMLKGGPLGGSDSNSTESEETYSEESSNSTDGKDGRGKKGPSGPRRNKPSRPSKKGADSESNSTYDMLKGGAFSDSNSTESEEFDSSNSTGGSKKRPSPKPRPSHDAWKFCHTGGNFGDQLTFHIKNGKCYPDTLTWAGETCGAFTTSVAVLGGVVSLQGMKNEIFQSRDFSVVLSALASSVSGWDVQSMEVTATSLHGRSLATAYAHDVQFTVSFVTEDFGVEGTLYAAAEALVADMTATLQAAISSGAFVQTLTQDALMAGADSVASVEEADLVSLEILSISYENNRLVYYYDSDSSSSVASASGPALSASVVVVFVAVIALAGVAVVGMIAHSYGSYQKVATASDSEVSEKVWLSGMKSKFGVKFEKLPADSEQMEFGLKI